MKLPILYRDCLSSYGYWSRTEDEVLEDENGKYRVKKVMREVPCSCHPETCNHFDGKKTVWYDEKVYIKE